MQREKYRYAEDYFAGGRKIYGAYHFIYGYFARRTGKDACLLQSPGESFSEWRNHNGIFQLHEKIGLIQEGRAVLYCCDEDGNEYVIDELNKDSVFGEPFLLSSDSQHYYVCATTVTKVLFIDYEHVIKRCENACHHHSQMVSNLLQMTALRSGQQTDRIYMLSRSSTRKKLIAYLHSLAAEKNAGKFKLPMSYTALAQYLSVDRSAMMREIKNLSDEGVIRRDGRNVELLK